MSQNFSHLKPLFIRALLVSTLIFSFTTSPIQAQWEVIYDVGSEFYYPSYCMEFINPDTGVICISNPQGGFKMLKTENTGDSWAIVFEDDFNHPVDFHFISDDTGYLVSANRNLWKTENSGTTWFLQSYNYAPNNINTIYFIDDQIGFTNYSKTIDGGLTWTDYTNTLANFTQYDFTTNDIGFAVGKFMNHGIHRTEDQGETWTKVDPFPSTVFLSICMLDETMGYASSSGGNLFKTLDSGLTWTLCSNQPYFNFDKIQFVNEQAGFAGASYGFQCSRVWKTLDGGINWVPIKALKHDLVDFQFFDESLGYVMNSQTATYKTVNGGGEGILPKYSNPEWINTLSSPTSVKTHSCKYDSQGNVFVTGHFKDSIYLNGTSITPSSQASNALSTFIMKMNSHGYMHWFVKHENIGAYENPLFIGPDDNPVVISPYGNIDISKYNQSGEVLWQKPLQASVYTADLAYEMDFEGNIYVAGSTYSPVYYEDQTFYPEGNSFFLLKTDESGAPLVLQELIAGDLLTYPFIKVDYDNNLYCCVRFFGTVYVGSDSITSNTSASTVIKFNESLEYQWSQELILSDAVLFPDVLELDNNNNLLLYGMVPNNSATGYIVKLDPDGQVLFEKSFSRIKLLYHNMATNGQNQMIASGNIHNYVEIDNEGMISYGDPELLNSMGDICVFKLDENGDLLWMNQLWNSYGSYGLDTYMEDYILVGNFIDELNLEEEVITTAWPKNAFIAQYNDQTITVANKEIESPILNIFPNPTKGQTTIFLNSKPTNVSHLEIFEIDGQKVYEEMIVSDRSTIDLSRFKSGVYFIKVNLGNKTYSQKIILQK